MFSFPDVATLRLCSILASIAYGAVFLIFWSRRRDEACLLHWGGSSILYAAVLIGFQALGELPPALPAALLTTLLAASILLTASGAYRFDGRQPVRPWMAVVMIVTLASQLVTAALPGPSGAVARGVAASIMLAACMTASAISIRRGGRDDMALARPIAAIALLTYLPGYVFSIVAALSGSALPAPVALFPMLSDQLLLGILNMALLALPLERALRDLKEAAFRDPLTGAANRAALKRRDAELAGADPHVLLMDLDHFKRINDSFGHAAGDAALQHLAETAERFARPRNGTFVRLGGDEFAMIVPSAVGTDGTLIADQLRRDIAEGDSLQPFTISIGISRVKPSEATLSHALSRADRSLYQAKARGRDQVAA